MQKSLNQYLLRVGFFLAIVFIIVVLIYPVLQNAFLSNIFINLINKYRKINQTNKNKHLIINIVINQMKSNYK